MFSKIFYFDCTMHANNFWETEKIGIAISCSCLVMVLFNRVHKYVPYLKCWSKGKNSGTYYCGYHM